MNRFTLLILFVLLALGCQINEKTTVKPTLFLIGDSTVKNGRGDGAGGLWGWGDAIIQYFDTSKINVENHALGGTSSRTFRSKGLWEVVLQNLKPGDYVLMQFGHNDAGALNDTLRARGTIIGTGEETVDIVNLLTGENETVYTYGWYMRQYIQEVKAKGAKPVIISPIPRNDWNNGIVPRNNQDYGKWAKEVAESEQVGYIDLNNKMASAMEKHGEENVTGTYFLKHDHTHTSAKGAVLASSLVVEGLEELIEFPLKNYLLDNPVIQFPVKKKLYLIGDSTVANGNDSIVGWGRELPSFFDTTRIVIINKARGGRSSRSYRFEGLWNEVLSQLNQGDYLLIQFGHNDNGYIDQPKFRGSIRGMGDETQTIIRPDSTEEVVHTYGWYMKQYIIEAKARGAEVMVVSQIPRNKWPNGKVERENESHVLWAKEAAEEAGAFYFDLHNTVANQYETMGMAAVKTFFPGDHTHTNAEGARFNAQTLAQLIKAEKRCSLNRYIQF